MMKLPWKFSILFPLFFLTSTALGAEELPSGQAMLWKEPAPVQDRDLFWGSGSEAERPVGPFTFDSEDHYGYNPKVFVKDSRGVRWGVKFGIEVHGEVAASRLLSAAGYRTHEMYFVPEGVIQGIPASARIPKAIDRNTGKFTNARFKRRSLDEGVAKVEDRYTGWKWDDNPFVGTKEFSGLILMNVMMSNFDTKPDNNLVETLRYRDGRVENWYMVGDVGSVFGRAVNGHSEWNLKDYAEHSFIEKAGDENLDLDFEGYSAKHMQRVPREHAKWLYGLIGGLKRSQIEDAFRAAFSDVRVQTLANPQDEALVKGFSDAFEKRLQELNRAVGDAAKAP